MKETIGKYIEEGKAVLGIEFGSTRIKAVAIGDDFSPIASGSHTWSDHLENGIWTYSTEQILGGLADCYRDLKASIKAEYGVTLKSFRAIGLSAMMHGYIPFDKDGNQLAGFRTWRNNQSYRTESDTDSSVDSGICCYIHCRCTCCTERKQGSNIRGS